MISQAPVGTANCQYYIRVGEVSHPVEGIRSIPMKKASDNEARQYINIINIKI